MNSHCWHSYFKNSGFLALCLVALLWPGRAQSQETSSLNELAVGTGILVPMSRPVVSFGIGLPYRSLTLAGRISVAYLSLTPSFKAAAEESQYAQKLSIDDASFTDVNIQLPDVTLWLWGRFFVSAAAAVRINRIVAGYTTSAEEPLVYTGLGVSTGLGVAGGYRLALSPAIFVDLTTEMHSPLWSFGQSWMDYNRDNSLASPTFVEGDLEQMLESLQPYLEKVTKQTNIGAGLRLVFML